jgi:hypothetical protein
MRDRHQPQIDEAAGRLRRKLMALDIGALDISDYSRNYLRGYRAHGAAHLNVCAHILSLSVRASRVDMARTGLIEYGGGNGLLSLLAREAGVGTVVYNDIFETSCTDAQRLASVLGLEADHYVPGDIPDLIAYLATNAIECQVICSYDVIEHVYDISAFLKVLPHVSGGPLRVVMASAANALNPRIKRRLMRIQRQVDNEDRVEETGHKERDALKAYRDIRADIIRGRAPTLDREQVDALATLTRGLAQVDIEAAVDSYRATGTYPPAPTHPTNTCDPITGNWAEHLMDPFALADMLVRAGLDAHVESGYYGFYLGRRGVIGSLLNRVIRATGSWGLRLAPYYILIGDKR